MNLSQGWQVIVQSFKTAYERIGLIMGTNLLWFVAGFAPALIVLYIPFQHPVLFVVGMLATVFTLGGAAGAVNHIIVRIINGEDDVRLSDFKVGFRKFFWRGSALAVAAIVGALI